MPPRAGGGYIVRMFRPSKFLTVCTAAALLCVIAACSKSSTTPTGTTTTFTPAVDRIVVTPATVNLSTGGKQQFTASVRDQRDSVMVGQTVTWSTTNAGVVTMASTGVATAVSPGTATVTATVLTKTGTATVHVEASTPSRLSGSLLTAERRTP